jgi:glycosyltransferase involved in cell wall biosynthesis
MNYSRVLIVGETFRNNGGGGVTLRNLFNKWPADKIGVVTNFISETDPGTNYLFYQLGDKEIKYPFPFSSFQTNIMSGPYFFNNRNDGSKGEFSTSKLSIKGKLRVVFERLLDISGLSFSFYKIRLSDELRRWIVDFNPDIIYIQPFHYKIIQFGNLLKDELNYPYAIHIMDDSISYINRSILFRRKWQRLIDEGFRRLVANAAIRMCISDSMAEEYLKRYGTPFIPFRNPIDSDYWLQHRRSTNTVRGELRIVYTGGLRVPVLDSLIDMCRVVDTLKRKNKPIRLDIYTYDNSPEFISKTRNFTGIKLCKPVNLKDIPKVMTSYDVVFMCLDFSPSAIRFAQFSISTRASESMISGVPILLYAPVNTALYQYFKNTGSACLVGEKNLQKLESSVVELWDNTDLRNRITENAYRTVLYDSDAKQVCERFRKALAIDNIVKNKMVTHKL